MEVKFVFLPYPDWFELFEMLFFMEVSFSNKMHISIFNHVLHELSNYIYYGPLFWLISNYY